MKVIIKHVGSSARRPIIVFIGGVHIHGFHKGIVLWTVVILRAHTFKLTIIHSQNRATIAQLVVFSGTISV